MTTLVSTLERFLLSIIQPARTPHQASAHGQQLQLRRPAAGSVQSPRQPPPLPHAAEEPAAGCCSVASPLVLVGRTPGCQAGM